VRATRFGLSVYRSSLYRLSVVGLSVVGRRFIGCRLSVYRLSIVGCRLSVYRRSAVGSRRSALGFALLFTCWALAEFTQERVGIDSGAMSIGEFDRERVAAYGFDLAADDIVVDVLGIEEGLAGPFVDAARAGAASAKLSEVPAALVVVGPRDPERGTVELFYFSHKQWFVHGYAFHSTENCSR